MNVDNQKLNFTKEDIESIKSTVNEMRPDNAFIKGEDDLQIKNEITDYEGKPIKIIRNQAVPKGSLFMKQESLKHVRCPTLVNRDARGEFLKDLAEKEVYLKNKIRILESEIRAKHAEISAANLAQKARDRDIWR
jgi:hypothetical protein